MEDVTKKAVIYARVSSDRQDVDLSISGGSEKANFYISGNFYNEKGTMVNTNYH